MNMMSIPIDYLALCSPRQVLCSISLCLHKVKNVSTRKIFSCKHVKLLVGLSQLWSRVVLHLSLTFHIFNFLSVMAEQNSSKLNRKQDFNILYVRSICFSGLSKNKDGPPGLWTAETFSTFLQPLYGIQRNLTEARSQRPQLILEVRGQRSRSQWAYTKNVWKWPYEHNPDQSHKHIFIRHNSNVAHDERMTPIDFGGQRYM